MKEIKLYKSLKELLEKSSNPLTLEGAKKIILKEFASTIVDRCEDELENMGNEPSFINSIRYIDVQYFEGQEVKPEHINLVFFERFNVSDVNALISQTEKIKRDLITLINNFELSNPFQYLNDMLPSWAEVDGKIIYGYDDAELIVNAITK